MSSQVNGAAAKLKQASVSEPNHQNGRGNLNGNQEVNDKIAKLVTDAFDAVMEIDANPINTTVVRCYDFSAGKI